MTHSYRLGLVTPDVPGSSPGRAGYLSSSLWIYSAPNFFKELSVGEGGAKSHKK